MLQVIVTLLAVTDTIAFAGFRIGFVFVDHEIEKVIKGCHQFCRTLWAVTAATSVVLIAILRIEIRNGEMRGAANVLFIICSVVTLFSTAASAAFLIRGGKAEIYNYFCTGMRVMPLILPVYMVLFAALIFTVIPFELVLIFSSAALAVFVAVLFRCLPIGRLRISSLPAVFDIGDCYNIVFASNIRSIGFVTYTFNGEKYTVYDSDCGRKNSCRIHHVYVPYEHLNGNSYTLSVQKAVEDIPYGGLQGKKAVSITINDFTAKDRGDLNLLTVADWHSTRIKTEDFGADADALVMLGDAANGIYSVSAVIRDIIAPAGQITKGSIPTIFVRGNHEYRGFDVNKIFRMLGFEKLYYAVSLGNYRFIVLDGGEDKPDDNYEYAGYTDSLSYVNKELLWLENQTADKRPTILLAHSPYIIENSEAAKRAEIKLAEIGTQLIVCGHCHSVEFIEPEDERYTSIPTYIGGCLLGGAEGRTFSRIHLRGGTARLEASELSGKIIYSKDVVFSKSGR